MTKDSNGRKLGVRLIKHQLNVLEELLAPLINGKSVLLVVSDTRLPKKTRKYSTTLVLTPLRQLGIDSHWLLAAMPPYGSELIDPKSDLKAAVFTRLGLRFTLASALADALRFVYGGKL